MAVEGEQASGIPVIDFAPVYSGNADEVAQTAKQVYEAFKTVGFAYIKNHGVPQPLIDEAFEWSRRFFALPQSDKDKAPHPPYGWHHRGYSGMGREKASQTLDRQAITERRKVPDCKESFDVGSEDNELLPNIWLPGDTLPGFRAFLLGFYETCYGVEERLLRATALGMGLDAGYFLGFHSRKNNQIRLLHYPPVDEELLRAGKLECIGAHTDFGTMTMLFQDDVGGLEVEDVRDKGRFNAAPYVPGTIVVNIGDLLMRWSNDELKSTLHRVRTPGTGDGRKLTRSRYSIPYFVCADGDRIIDCAPGSFGPGRPKKYEPIECREYIDMRMNAI